MIVVINDKMIRNINSDSLYRKALPKTTVLRYVSLKNVIFQSMIKETTNWQNYTDSKISPH